MPISTSLSSLRNKTRESASLCHEQDEPISLTTNGEGGLVVMSIEHYERLKARVDLFDKLALPSRRPRAENGALLTPG